MERLITSLLLIIIISFSLQSQNSILEYDANASEQIMDLAYGDVLAGDYDADGDMDIMVSGTDSSASYILLYRNDGLDQYTMIDAGFPALVFTDLSWCDPDNDGDLDILVSGAMEENDTLHAQTFLFINEDGEYEEVEVPFIGVYSGCSAWADLDLDGDQDLILNGATGKSENGWITFAECKVYRNEGNYSFTAIDPGIKGVFNSNIDVADYDKDSYPDIVITGELFDDASAWHRITSLYHNEGNNTFINVDTGLPELRGGDIEFGDFNNDAYPDIVLSGDPISPTNLVYIFKNNKDGTFYDIGIEILGTADGSINWIDYDIDGDLDFILSGLQYPSADAPVSEIYRNVGNDMFAFDGDQNLQGLMFSSADPGDLDNDLDPDLILMGYEEKGLSMPGSLIYDNISSVQNTAPLPPTQLLAEQVGNMIYLTWNEGFDPETPAGGLTYNIRIGRNPGGKDIITPLSLFDGSRQVFDKGNASQNLSHMLHDLEEGTYYWSVQSVDHTFIGSEFGEEASFSILNTRLDEANSIIGFQVFPVPVKEVINIRLQSNASYKSDIKLVNSIGQCVDHIKLAIRTGHNVFRIPVKDLANGLYLLTLSEGGILLYSEKLIISGQ